MDNKTNKEQYSMGIPKLLCENNVEFIKTNRFLLIPENYSEFQYLIKKVSVDFLQKKLKFEIQETKNATETFVQNWIVQNLIKENQATNFKLVSLSGQGFELYTVNLLGAKIKAHEVQYDYKMSEVVTHQLGFEYVEMTNSVDF